MSESRTTDSGIYKGFVRHRRFAPALHEFRYPLFMAFIRLDELPQLQRNLFFFGDRFWHWARFRRADYLGDPTQSIQQAVKDLVADRLNLQAEKLTGSVYFFGHLRYLGFYFSPLNLYYLEHEGRLRYMVAEVSNTPWNERHYYAIDLDNLAPHDKQFHVSPFNPMSQRYQWKVRVPGRDVSKAMVHLGVLDQQSGDTRFDATMVLKRLPLNQGNLIRVLLSTPAQTFSMVVGIYWQALKLYLKKVPFYPHPARQHKQPEAPR